MSFYYEVKTKTSPPLTLGEVKSFLRIPFSKDDSYIEFLIAAATDFGERYTKKDFRAVTRTLYIDEFSDCIRILQFGVSSIVSITYPVSEVQTTVDSSLYYLKKYMFESAVLLKVDKSWPTDGDDIEQGIQIEFTTAALDEIEIAKEAVLLHISHMYRNRGDCTVESSAKESGAVGMYDNISVPLI